MFHLDYDLKMLVFRVILKLLLEEFSYGFAVVGRILGIARRLSVENRSPAGSASDIRMHNKRLTAARFGISGAGALVTW